MTIDLSVTNIFEQCATLSCVPIGRGMLESHISGLYICIYCTYMIYTGVQYL
jgi:hypothetical protein